MKGCYQPAGRGGRGLSPWLRDEVTCPGHGGLLEEREGEQPAGEAPKEKVLSFQAASEWPCETFMMTD